MEDDILSGWRVEIDSPNKPSKVYKDEKLMYDPSFHTSYLPPEEVSPKSASKKPYKRDKAAKDIKVFFYSLIFFTLLFFLLMWACSGFS